MNRLFIVCPFSNMEVFVQKRFGTHTLFLTSMGAQVPCNEYQQIMTMRDLLESEQIESINLVNDTDCRFLNAVVKRELQHRTAAKSVLEEIYIDHFYQSFHNRPEAEQIARLAALHLQQQMNNLRESSLLGDYISANSIEVKAWLTTRAKGRWHQLKSSSSLLRAASITV